MKKLKIRTCLMLAVFVLFSTDARSMERDSNEATSNEYRSYTRYNYAIGGGAGFATGYGLSFRYIPGQLGGQVNFAPYKDGETERYSFGITLIHILIEGGISNLYVYQANHYYYNSQTLYIFDPLSPSQPKKTRETENYFNDGLGFGIEIIVAKRIGINLMAGYAFYKNFSQVNVTGETALYYKF